MKVLVDTAIWSLALRRKAADLNAVEESLVQELRELIQEGRVQLPGLVRQELLSGIKTAAQYERLRGILRAFPDEPADIFDYEAAATATASNSCRAKGIAMATVDALICAIALRRKLLIFTTDSDFQNYSNVLPLRLHVPRKHTAAGKP
jgi:predicted nucleic acid-binding protein